MAEFEVKPDTENADGAAGTDPVWADISENSYWVLPAVQEILDEQPQLKFSVEDVYNACHAGTATLWVAEEGFVVSTGETDQFTGDRTFILWLAWTMNRGQNCVFKYYDFFAKAAKEMNFKTVETRTPIRRLEPHLLAQGWTLDTVVYTREL